MEDIRKWRQMPMVTVIRLLGAMRRRLKPRQAGPPGMDVDENQDKAIIAELEKKIAAAKKQSQ